MAGEVRRYRVSGFEQAILAIAAGLLFILAAASLLGAFAAAEPGGAVALVALAAAILPVSFYIVEEARASRRLAISIADGRLNLDLPARRGAARLDPLTGEIAIRDIVGVDFRGEAFSFLQWTMIQTAWRLRLSDGGAIILGAGRPMKQRLFGDVAAEIARRRGFAPQGLGMVDGHFGTPLFQRASIPPWSAPPLDVEQAEARRRAAAATLRESGATIGGGDYP